MMNQEKPRHISVILLYFKGNFLLQHRSEDAKRSPGLWGFFGGGIEEGETPLEAVKRECFEELTYQLKNPEKIFEQQFLSSNGTHPTKHVFIENYDGSIIDQKEGQAMKWVSIKEALKKEMIKHDKAVLEELKELLTQKFVE